jgi:hypothetical protein
MTHLLSYANIVLDAAVVLYNVSFFIKRIWRHIVLFLSVCGGEKSALLQRHRICINMVRGLYLLNLCKNMGEIRQRASLKDALCI